jgi:molybdopterin converting factor small subunit
MEKNMNEDMKNPKSRQIEVRYFATFRKNKIKKEYIEHVVGMTVMNILDLKGIEENEVAILLVNGIRKESNTALEPGDIVSLFPPVGGG